MEQSLPQDNRAPLGIKSWQLWFSLAAGVVTWVIHLMLVYPLTSLTCAWGWFPFTVGGLSGLQVVQIVVTIIAAAITILAGYFAFQNQRRLRGSETIQASRHYFMSWMGVALNILFTALIVTAFIPVLTLPVCSA